MSVVKYKIAQKKKFYTVVVSDIAQLPGSLEVIGLYTYLASLPPDWEFSRAQLCAHCAIGRDKLSKLLKKLEDLNLIRVAQNRAQNGKFLNFSMDVLDGGDIKINKLDKKNCAPFTDPPYTANQLLVPGSYKIYNTKEDIKKETTLKSYCASNDTHSRFKEFWDLYPRKKDKARAAKIWERKGCDANADMILKDIRNRMALDAQWQDPQYIPHPTTYLNGQRWEDDITLVQAKPLKAARLNGKSEVSAFDRFMANQGNGRSYDNDGNDLTF